MTRHGELGAALHRWRDRIAPAGAGQPGGSGTPGLRREELARLAGLSVDYVTRLEQGLATSPSSQVLAALARALHLSDVERRHLFLLAGHSPPATDRIPCRVPPSVRRLLEGMATAPVGVHDAAWNLITWNRAWSALLGEPARTQGSPCRNLAWRHFAELPTRVGRTPEQEAHFEAAIVSDLRDTAARYPTDIELRALVGELRKASGRFAALWTSRVTGSHDSDSATVRHPDAGPLDVDCDVVTVPGSDLRVLVYSAVPGSASAATLALLTSTDAGDAWQPWAPDEAAAAEGEPATL
jgi:transcriptional regulator with XRE-family HTH domain